VNIRFEEGGDWITVNGTTNWNYDWNTTNLVTDVPDVHTIEVQCHTNQSKSEIQGILVIIKKDTDKETDLPSFDENKYFQWYFPPGFIPKPNQEYKMKIYYRQRTIEKKLASRHPIAIEIDGIQDKEDYLTVSFPREKISTTPDNETYVYEYTVSLSDDAPKDNLIVFTVAYSYYADISPLNLNLFDWNPFKTSDTQDVFIIPGSW